MTTYLHTTRVYITIPLYTATLTRTVSSTEGLAIWEYILTRHNLDVARNTRFKEVLSRVYEYFVSENNL